MAKNVQRQSQLVSTFGPGSMVDLPTRSVVVGGLDTWKLDRNVPPILEPRLSGRLEQLLKAQLRMPQEAHLSLRQPPPAADNQARFFPGVDAPVFPTWFLANRADRKGERASVSRRRLIPWSDLDPKGRRKADLEDGGPKTEVTPVRFVCACDRGHLQDLDWRWFVHRGEACREPMWLEESGASGSLEDTRVVCGCSRSASLIETRQNNRLGKCQGKRPWLRDEEACDQSLRLLIRTATNTYFSQTLTVISLPAEEDALSALVAELAGDLAEVTSVGDLPAARRFNPRVREALKDHDDAEVWVRLLRLRATAGAETRQPPKVAEFDLFASGRAEIGENAPNAKLYAQTLPRQAWAGGAEMDLSAIRNLVAVHRLREVSCLYGFTRFQSSPSRADGDVEELDVAVEGAAIGRDVDWLPAVEQFGEGLFIHIDHQVIADWLKQDPVVHQHDLFMKAFGAWASQTSGQPPLYPGTPYVLLHSLSHALMAEIALDCGYPASSLKERIYALPDTPGGGLYTRCGILIYTASAGAQGTLGGLVATASHFAGILKSALDRLRICSNDPICADHEPDNKSGDRATHGAACHGCLLIAETSCEMRNLYLDRNLLVPTMAGGGAGLFR